MDLLPSRRELLLAHPEARYLQLGLQLPGNEVRRLLAAQADHTDAVIRLVVLGAGYHHTGEYQYGE